MSQRSTAYKDAAARDVVETLEVVRDIEGIIDNAEYILLCPWLWLKLAAIEAALEKLEEGASSSAKTDMV